MRGLVVYCVLLTLLLHLCGAESAPSAYNYCQAGDVVSSVNIDGLTLRHVAMVIRHGDRTPANVLPGVGNLQEWDCILNKLEVPSDSLDPREEVDRLYRKVYLPKREVLPGNCMFGQLTKKGYRQHLELGAQLRKLYVEKYGLLGPKLNVSEIWIRSTDVPRTLQSAQGLLQGLYPTSKHGDGSIPVVQINTLDSALEDLYVNENLCNGLYAIEGQMYNTSAWINYHNQYNSLNQQLQIIFNSTNLPIWGSISDVLEAMMCHGFSLPKGITHDMAVQIKAIADWELNFMWKVYDPYVKIGMGFFIQELLDRFTGFVNGNDPAKFVLYSAHDSSVGPIVGTLGMFDGLWPPYRSHVHFELWSNESKEFFVQVKYNDKVLHPPGCSDVMCPYSQFKQLLRSRIPKYPDVCQ